MIKLLAALWGSLSDNGRADWSLENMQYWNNLDAALRHIQSKKGYQVHFWDRETWRDPTVKRPLRDTDDFISKSVWSSVYVSLEHGLLDRDRHIYIRTIKAGGRTPLEQYIRDKYMDLRVPEPRYVFWVLGITTGLRRLSPFEYEELIVGWFEENPLNLDEV